MKKFKHKLILFSSIFLFSGCVDLQPVKPTSTGGNPINNPAKNQSVNDGSQDYEINVLGDEQAKTDRISMLQNIISTKFQETKKLSINLTTTSKWNDLIYIKQQNSQETYQDGRLTGYLANQNIKVGNESLTQSSFFDGEKYYNRFNGFNWHQEESDFQGSTLYLFFMKLLFEGKDNWNLEDGIESLNVKRRITDETLLSQMYQLIDIPVMLSDKPEIIADTHYQINEKNGEISHINVKLTINDLGENYQIEVNAIVNNNPEFDKIEVDTMEEMQEIDTTDRQFSEYFKEANPIGLINFYEEHIHEKNGNEESTKLMLNNIFANQPLMSILGDIINEQFINVGVIKGEQFVSRVEEEIKTDKSSLRNDYAFFVNRAIEQYDVLNSIEVGEEDSVYTLRELFENDFDGFSNAAGFINVDNLKKEGNVIYAIDYVIDRKTQQLQAVYLWGTSVEEEEVQNLIQLAFSNFNGNNPNYVTHNVDSTVWETIRK